MDCLSIMAKSNLKTKQKRWDEIFEERQLKNAIRKFPSRPKEDQNHKFVLESRFQLMAESLQKTKFGSSEFEALLNECVDIFLEAHPEKANCDRDSILKMTRDRIFKEELVGELDDKKVPSDNKKEWPKSGFIPLREAIKKKDIGQNPSSKEPEIVKNVFAGDKTPDKYPSPSSETEPKD